MGRKPFFIVKKAFWKKKFRFKNKIEKFFLKKYFFYIKVLFLILEGTYTHSGTRERLKNF